MKIILDKERPVGWNRFYAGKHYSDRSAEANYVHSLFLPHKTKWRRRGLKPLENKVNITITGYFMRDPLDPDNIACKFYIDGLKGWLLTDDDMRYVDSVKSLSRIDKDNPRIEIDIEEVLSES